MLSRAEKSVMNVFRTFMVRSGEMICFTAPQLQKYGPTLVGLAKKDLVVRERFAGGYSLTREGFAAMMDRRPAASAGAQASRRGAKLSP